MRYLLDTHVFLWFAVGSRRLSTAVAALIRDSENESLVSVASIWEIGIKNGLGKLEPLPDEPEVLLGEADLKELEITLSHAKRAGQLPLIHRDPFDRMLVAQAQVEDLILITDDGRIEMTDGLKGMR